MQRIKYEKYVFLIIYGKTAYSNYVLFLICFVLKTFLILFFQEIDIILTYLCIQFLFDFFLLYTKRSVVMDLFLKGHIFLIIIIVWFVFLFCLALNTFNDVVITYLFSSFFLLRTFIKTVHLFFLFFILYCNMLKILSVVHIVVALNTKLFCGEGIYIFKIFFLLLLFISLFYWI